MKLRLPNKLQAALIAALASVSFTTLSTGTIAVATGAALLAGQQAQAADEELTTFTTTNSTSKTVNNFNAKGFIITLNGPRLTTTPTSTCDLVDLDSITLASLRGVPSGSSVTLALADANGKVLSLSDNVVSSTGRAEWEFKNTTVATDSPLYFYWLDTARGIAKGDFLTSDDMATWTNPGCGSSGVIDYGNQQNLTSCGFLDSLSHVQSTQYAPKLTIVTSGPVPQAEYTWKATDTPALWDEETANWTLKDADSPYTSGTVTIVNFNDGVFAKEVTVVGAIEAGTVNVGANYEFTVGSGASLSISKLSVASGAKVTVENAGELYLAKVTGAGALEVGAGTVNLFGGNDFSGGLTVSGGVVHATQVSALGTGTRTATGTGVIEIENTAPGNLTVLGNGTLRLMTTYAASSQQSNVELGNIQAANLSLAADEHHSSRFRNQNNPDLSQVGHLYFDGGQMWVSKDFTYSGAVTFNETVYKEVRTQPGNKLNDAALRVNANVTLTGKVDVAHDTRFTWQASSLAVEFGGEVVGSGNLELAIYSGSSNTFRISGNASAYGGSITSASGVALDITSGGKLSIGSASSLAGAVSLAGVLNVNDSATISGAISGAGTLTKNGAGTLTLSGNNSSFTGATNVNAGTLSMNGNSLGGILTVETDAAATFSGAVTLASYIRNSGSVTFNAGSTLTLTCSLDDLEGSATYTAGDNGFISGVEKRIASGAGTVTGLTSVTIGGTTYTKDNGQITDDGAISIHDTNYTTYYLRTEGAEVDVPAQQTDHAEFKNISVAGKGGATITGNILVNGTVSLDSLNIASGNTAAVALSEGATAATANIAALTHDGTLDIGSGVTVHYTPTTLTVDSGKTLTTTGEGMLDVTTLKSAGGAISISSNLKVTGGGDGKGGTHNHEGLAITGDNGTVDILDGVTTVTGAVYTGIGNSASTLTLNVGTGDNDAVLVARRIELGDSNGGTAAFTVGQHGKVVVTGNEDIRTGGNPQKNTSLQMSEWNQVVTSNIRGKLLAQYATAFMSNDNASIINIDGGTMAVKGIATTSSTSDKAHTVSLDNNGKLVMGTFGLAAEAGTWNISVGEGEIGMYDTATTVGRNITVNGTLTLNTSRYDWSGTGAETVLTQGSTGGTMTVSSILSGTGALVVDGAGTLVLSGANTYSGGTTVNAGTLKAGSLGTGDITVTGGTLELTSSISTQGDLSITGGTLVFAGAEMLTAGSLAVNGTVTFDLNNISATKAGTITLATGTTEDGALTNVNVSWTLPSGFNFQNLRAQDNAWVIDLVSTGQALVWAGGEGNWSYSEQDLSWLTPGGEPVPTHFTDKDTAVFTAAGNPAVANITEAIATTNVEVQAGANVTLQAAAAGAESASLTVAELEIGGTLSTSVDVAATAVLAQGADAAWNITAGTVATGTITMAESTDTLTLSGSGSITVDALAGAGKVVVNDGFTLTLSQEMNQELTPQALSILNNGNVEISLGNSQNVINMDAASTGNLYVKSGHISYLSELGSQTLHMANGTQLWFGDNAGTQDAPVFDNNIVLNGDVTLRVYGNSKHSSVTISGDVDGAGHTLTKTDGNQVLTFTGVVNLGGLNTSNNGGGTIIFAGGEGSIGKISTPTSVTIRFSAKEGSANVYTFDTFAMSPSGSDTRWLIVDQGVTVHGTGSNLGDDHNATIMNSWGVNNGGLEVNGTLTTDGVIGMDAGNTTAYIKGTGTINTAGLNLCNYTTTHIQGGITINITSDTGIYKRNNDGSVQLKDATLKAVDVDWSIKDGGGGYTVALADATTGTTFNAAAERAITIANILSGSGKLVKDGEGSLIMTKANTYTGPTVVNAGTLEVAGSGSLGTGAIAIAEEATLQFDGAYTIANSVSGAGTIAYNGTTAATINFGDKNISGWTGSFDNVSSQAVTLTINTTGLNMDITHTGTGLVNLSLGVDNICFAGEQLVNNVAHSTNWSSYIGSTGKVTATGKVVTGRLVLGETQADADAVFTLSGADAQLYNNNGTEHKYTAVVQGYGTFAVVNGATQTLTKLNNPNQVFHGTLMAEGMGSILTIDSTLASDVRLLATDGGKVVLTSAVDVKEAAVDNGTFDLNADVETLNVSGDNNTLNIGTGSVENINLGGNVKVDGNLDNFYIYSSNTGTKVTAGANTALTVHGTAHVDGRVEFHASETQDVKIAATRVVESEQYALERANFDVTADTVKKVASGDVEVANQVSAREVVNAVAEGTLSLTAGVNMEALKNVIAASGDIEFLNVDAEATLDTLNIAGGKTVSFSTGDAVGDIATEATVTVAGTLTAGTGATLNANLVMDGAEDSPAVLDVHAMGGIGGLNMGSNVTLVQGRVALSQEDIDAVTNLQFKDKYDLFNEVDGFIVGENPYGYTDTWVNAKEVFANNFGDQDYYLFYSGANTAGGKGGNVGTIYIMRIPEPTTGTLSLLALCALAARRRRK